MGRSTLEYLQSRSTQQWEVTEPQLPRKAERQKERKSHAGETIEKGTGIEPQVESYSHKRSHRWTSDDDVHPSRGTPSHATAAGQTGQGSDTRRRSSHQRRSRRRSTKGGRLSIRSRKAQLNPRSGYRTSHSRNAHNRSQGKQRRKHRKQYSSHRRGYCCQCFGENRSRGDSNSHHTLPQLPPGSPASNR